MYWLDSYGTVVPCTFRQSLATTALNERDLALCSMAGSGGAPGRNFASWFEHAGLLSGFDVQGAVWDGCGGGLVVPICGSPASCPCTASGATGHGCPNSANSEGALLEWSGDASVSADTLVFSASGMPPTATCLFFQGASAGIPGSPLGDGHRCVFGPIVRFPVKFGVGGVALYPGPGDPAISAHGLVPAGGEVSST
jgi:hypothetical protein